MAKTELNTLTVNKDGVVALNGVEIPQCLSVEVSDMRKGEPITIKLALTAGEVNIAYKP